MIIIKGKLEDSYKRLIYFAADYYKLADLTVNVVANDGILDRFSTPGVHLRALLHKNPIPHSYNLILRDGVCGLTDIVCHEMVHLEQYESGRLSLSLEEKEFTWEGEVFPASVPYEERPWEIEAFSDQVKIKRKFKKSI